MLPAAGYSWGLSILRERPKRGIEQTQAQLEPSHKRWFLRMRKLGLQLTHMESLGWSLEFRRYSAPVT